MSKVKKKSAKNKSNVQASTKDPKMQEKYATMQADLYYLQGWFLRASWENKAKFITKAIRSIKEPATLKSIILSLSPMTKDILYSTSQTTKYAYDIVPIDDDRCLDETILNKNIEINLYWLNTAIDERDKLDILLYLIKIGGAKLAKLAIAEANTLSNILEFITFLEFKFKKQTKLKHTQKLANLISKEINKNSNILPLTNEYKDYSSFQTVSTSKVSERDTKSNEKQFKRLDKNSKKRFNESLNKVKNQQNLWDKELKKLIHMARTGLPERTRMVVGQRADLDALQSLPVWINRQIVNLLDDESKKNLANVNRYWRYTIDEVEREKTVRKNLNGSIKNLENRLMKMKMKLPGKRFVAPVGKMRKRARSVESRRKSKKNIKKSRSADLEELLSRPIGIKDDFKESVYKFVKNIPHKQIPFNSLYNDMFIPTVYMYDRAIDCNRRWIAATENTFLVFYNIITGAKTPFVLSGHSLVVTCVAFFPKSLRIVSGSSDKTVRTWNLWDRKVIEVFEGHKDVILSVSANEEYVVSCGRDSEVRVFKQLSGGICIQMIKETHWTPTMATLSEDNIVYWSTREGAINMFSITDKNINKSIDSAHKTDVIYIGKYEKLIVTIGNDNYVRIWNPYFQYNTCLTAFLHESSVNAAVVSCLTLITACTDGALRFWHIGTGLLFRKIQINFSDMAMISLNCQEFYNHVKIICNNEANIYVLEFPKYFKTNFNKDNPYQGIRLHPLADGKKVTAKGGRLIKQYFHRCTLPEYRKFINFKNYSPSTNAIVKGVLTDSGGGDCFPRYCVKSTSGEDVIEFNEDQWL